jgi:tetratricopeptide (TPR) repeat protein
MGISKPPAQLSVQSHSIGSALAAYREDVRGREPAFGSDDGAWIGVAVLLEHAALLPPDEQEAALKAAIDGARTLVGAAEVTRRAEREWPVGYHADGTAIMLLAEDVLQAGAHHLAAAILDALLRARPSASALDRGRILAQRARAAWKMGRSAEAEERYEYLESLGRRAKSGELVARAWIGLTTLAQMRGNYPDMRRHATRAVRLAEREGLQSLVRRGRYALLVVAGVAGRFEEALTHGWKVYQASVGDDVDEGEILQTLGQLLLEAGHANEARASFAAVVSRVLPARVILPALGGLAVASAKSADPGAARWAVGEVLREPSWPVSPYVSASALVECATALAVLGHAAEAARCASAALDISRYHGFHELEFRAESTANVTPVQEAAPPMPRRVARVAREIQCLEPERLPEHVTLAAVATGVGLT